MVQETIMGSFILKLIGYEHITEYNKYRGTTNFLIHNFKYKEEIKFLF